MIGKHTHCHSKPALKARILMDIGDCLQRSTEEGLDKMFAYLLDTKSSLRYWIKEYTKKHCEKLEEDGQPRLVNIAKNQLSHMISFLRNKVSQTSKDKGEKVCTKTWVSDFCTDDELISRLELDVEAFKDLGGIKEVNLENFAYEIRQGLIKVQEKLNRRFEFVMSRYDVCTIKEWKVKPHDLIFDRLSGCCEQCPFCKEQCECTDPCHTSKHSVQQHRPQCLGKYAVVSTKEITLDLCTTDVGSHWGFINQATGGKSHPYKEYQKIYPRWSIPVDLSSQASVYWKWFVGHYHTQIAEHYKVKTTNIPRTWTQLRWEDVKRSLQSLYNV